MFCMPVFIFTLVHKTSLESLFKGGFPWPSCLFPDFILERCQLLHAHKLLTACMYRECHARNITCWQLFSQLNFNLRQVNNNILGLHVMLYHYKIPLNSRCHFLDARNAQSSVMLVKLPIFGFLVIILAKQLKLKKKSIFPKLKRVCMGFCGHMTSW